VFIYVVRLRHRFDELRGLKPSVDESRALAVLWGARDAIDRGCVSNKALHTILNHV
jgi:hypothetical protein